MKWFREILLAGAMLGALGNAAFAEEGTMPALATQKVQESVTEAANWLPEGNWTPFLEKQNVPTAWSFQPIVLPGLETKPEGKQVAALLTIPERKAAISVIALGLETKGQKADENFQGMFVPGGYTQEAGKKMLAFNMGLLKSENLLNELFLRTVIGTRQATGQAIPFDLMAVDMLTIEQLHKVKTMEDTYTFALRPLVVADGWTLPLYIRGVAAKRDGAYRFLLLTGWDNSRAAVDKAALRIVTSGQ